MDTHVNAYIGSMDNICENCAGREMCPMNDDFKRGRKQCPSDLFNRYYRKKEPQEKKQERFLANIEPREMPGYLNELADRYFKNDPENWMKLVQCSAFIHGANWREVLKNVDR